MWKDCAYEKQAGDFPPVVSGVSGSGLQKERRRDWAGADGNLARRTFIRSEAIAGVV